nr:hypothetical protein BaRGS_032545 [Batillaria attramentaria]
MTKMSPKVLLATLEAVYDMTPNDIYLVKTLATQVLWLTRRLPMPLLVQVLQLHLSHQETPLRESIVQQTLSVLERRWVELTSMKDIIYLMYNMNSGTPVLHTEVASKSKVVELVQFLQQKIKEALKDLASRPRS